MPKCLVVGKQETHGLELRSNLKINFWSGFDSPASAAETTDNRFAVFLIHSCLVGFLSGFKAGFKAFYGCP